MKQKEKLMLQEIVRLFTELEVATYGKERANGRSLRPDARNFNYCAKRIYDTIEELVDGYQPDYITASDYNFICDSKRTLLLELEVFKDRNKLEDDDLTYQLEKYLVIIQGLFGRILSYCKNPNSWDW